MNKKLLVLSLSAISLMGCSSPEPELSYDPLELIEYETCLSNPPEGLQSNWAQVAEVFCKNKKPILK